MKPDEDGGLFGCRPVLCVESVARSIAYYVESLGFHVGFTWSGAEKRFLHPDDLAEPDFALIGKGKVQLFLSQESQGAPGMWIHLDVHTADQLDALHAEWTHSAAHIVEPPSLRSWGTYEMRVQDLDNHIFRVSAPPRKEQR